MALKLAKGEEIVRVTITKQVFVSEAGCESRERKLEEYENEN